VVVRPGLKLKSEIDLPILQNYLNRVGDDEDVLTPEELEAA